MEYKTRVCFERCSGGVVETFAFLATNPPESCVFPCRGRRGSWRDPSYHQRDDRGIVKADAEQQIQQLQEVVKMYPPEN